MVREPVSPWSVSSDQWFSCCLILPCGRSLGTAWPTDPAGRFPPGWPCPLSTRSYSLSLQSRSFQPGGTLESSRPGAVEIVREILPFAHVGDAFFVADDVDLFLLVEGDA